jgi:hypothetical protein
LASTVCEVEMLTTASITFSATSAMPSGPRAKAGAEASKLAALSEIAAPHQAQATAQGGSGTGHVGFSPKGRFGVHSAPERVRGASI